MKRAEASKLITAAVFLVLLIHGALLGPTDDEAYYWTLALRPGFGFAFHPPGVVWGAALFDRLLGPVLRWIGAYPAPILFRLPAALGTAWILHLAVQFFRDTGVDREGYARSLLMLLGFGGFFSVSWMWVPDLPLFMGLMWLIVRTWKIVGKGGEPGWPLAAAALLISLSKFSAVLALGSAGVAFLLWGGKGKWRAVAWLSAGSVLALIPIVIWNVRNEWGAIAYQVSERHGGSLDPLRFGKFWAAQLVLAGPPLIAAAFAVSAAGVREIARGGAKPGLKPFLMLWILPPLLVFGLQPLFSSFKLHWAFAAWFPAALYMAHVAGTKGFNLQRKLQAGWGYLLIVLVLISCHAPLIGLVNQWTKGGVPDPRWDVTNDMYGWDGLDKAVEEELGGEALKLPVVGSRYQTASQAAFHWPSPGNVTRIPRDRREYYDWPQILGQEVKPGEWPALKGEWLFVADNRYLQPPSFPESECTIVLKKKTERWGLPAKWIRVWKCRNF